MNAQPALTLRRLTLNTTFFFSSASSAQPRPVRARNPLSLFAQRCRGSEYRSRTELRLKNSPAGLQSADTNISHATYVNFPFNDSPSLREELAQSDHNLA